LRWRPLSWFAIWFHYRTIEPTCRHDMTGDGLWWRLVFGGDEQAGRDWTDLWQTRIQRAGHTWIRWHAGVRRHGAAWQTSLACTPHSRHIACVPLPGSVRANSWTGRVTHIHARTTPPHTLPPRCPTLPHATTPPSRTPRAAAHTLPHPHHHMRTPLSAVPTFPACHPLPPHPPPHLPLPLHPSPPPPHLPATYPAVLAAQPAYSAT